MNASIFPAYASPSQYREAINLLGGFVSFCKGKSMRPLIKERSNYVGVVAVDDPQIDDILLFEEVRRGENRCILHRLIEITPDGTYITRGDNCYGCEYLKREQIIGRAKYIYWVKQKGHFMPWLLGATREPDGGYTLSVASPRYLRYVSVWNALWCVRRPYYRLRGGIYSRLSKIGWLRRLYHKTIQFRDKSL